MVHGIGLGAAAFAALLISATSALAADPGSCGLPPFAPALPDPASIAQMTSHDAEVTRHGAFEDIINWQKGLKTYRACLNTLIDGDNRKIALDKNSGSKDDLTEVKGLQGEVTQINARYDSTVTTEQNIVASYNAVTKAYCSRKDVDQSVCQQAK